MAAWAQYICFFLHLIMFIMCFGCALLFVRIAGLFALCLYLRSSLVGVYRVVGFAPIWGAAWATAFSVIIFHHISEPCAGCNRKWGAARHGQKRLSLLPQWRSEWVLYLIFRGLDNSYFECIAENAHLSLVFVPVKDV